MNAFAQNTLMRIANSAISAHDRKFRQLVRVPYLLLVLKEFVTSVKSRVHLRGCLAKYQMQCAIS